MEQKITYVPATTVHPSKLNPRKSIDNDSLQELSNSIKEVGILSPIIVRNNESGWEIVCGERRFKAAVMAQIDTIPVIIRDLDDDQAMDLMITENLQRQDVSPIEEAKAFQNLIELRGYTVQGLIERFAKSEKYIRHRLKLNDLIPELQEQLNKDMISIGHAYEICKLEAKYQKEIFKEYFSESERNRNWYSLPSVSQIKGHIKTNYTHDLSEAAFSLKDATLDKKAGPCIVCQYNSATNTLLFPDMPAKGVCLNPPCYKQKSDIDFERKVNKILEEEPGTILGYTYAYGDDEKWIKAKKKEGLPICEVGYSGGLRHIDKKEYKADNPSHVKVFRVDNSSKGKIEYFKRLKTPDGKAETLSAKQQIDELRAKDARNKELTFEKLYLKAKDILHEHNYTELNTYLTPNEYIALYVIMMENASEILRKELLGKESYYIENIKKLPAAQSITPDQAVRLTRSFIQSKLANGSPNYNISESKITLEICKQFFPEEINPIELELDGKYLNRKKKIDERIAEIEAQTPAKKETKKSKKTA